MKRIFLYFVYLLFIFIISCDSDTAYDSDSVVKDDAGNIFPLDFKPKRVISLAPNITETIYELKAEDLLVGVTNYCDYPPETKLKEKIGSLLDPNMEKIASLNPDLIFMTTEGNSKYTYLTLKSNGYKVFVANPNDINGITKMVKNLGTVLGKKVEGKKIAEKIEDTKKYYSIQKDNSNGKACFMIISLNPLITVNKFTYLNEIMKLAGVRNIYSEEFLEYPNVNYEDVLIKNPDIICFLCDTTKTPVVNETVNEIKSRLSAVNACKNNRVFGLDENVFSRPGPRVMDGVKILNLKVLQ